jgi:hypothetical protein
MTGFFCEAEVRPDDPSPLVHLAVTDPDTGEVLCPLEATRRIEVVNLNPATMNVEHVDEHFLCSWHTLEWLRNPNNKRTMYIIESLNYPHRGVEVASWIGPSGEDGLEPPIGTTYRVDPGF